MKHKYPDPGVKPAEEAPPTTKSKGKDGAAKKGKVEEVVVVKEIIDEGPEASIMDIDSVIDDGEIPEFTADCKFMRGAAVDEELRGSMDEAPKSEYISNLSAKKTGYQTKFIFKDFENKKENLLDILEQHNKAGIQDFRVRTKGKFNDHMAQGPDTNYFRDLGWQKRANPMAAQQEKNFYDRDLFLMEKRRF